MMRRIVEWYEILVMGYPEPDRIDAMESDGNCEIRDGNQ